MNRKIAVLLLATMVIGLLFSIYFSFQGRFAEALIIYPFLIVIYVFSRISRKEEK